jgi:hypothetical protein
MPAATSASKPEYETKNDHVAVAQLKSVTLANHDRTFRAVRDSVVDCVGVLVGDICGLHDREPGIIDIKYLRADEATTSVTLT